MTNIKTPSAKMQRLDKISFLVSEVCMIASIFLALNVCLLLFNSIRSFFTEREVQLYDFQSPLAFTLITILVFGAVIIFLISEEMRAERIRIRESFAWENVTDGFPGWEFVVFITTSAVAFIATHYPNLKALANVCALLAFYIILDEVISVIRMIQSAGAAGFDEKDARR